MRSCKDLEAGRDKDNDFTVLRLKRPSQKRGSRPFWFEFSFRHVDFEVLELLGKGV